ncbi:MAG TPA: flavin reductase family protein [Gemmataceae bacterium]|nr:flavin reductase family protein [Gemmataceae bacterium]
MQVTTEADRQMFAALGRVPSGLFILTAQSGIAETGMLASWVQQCAFDPPHLCLALKRDRSIVAWLDDDAPFTLNILDDNQTDMIAHFGRGFEPGDPAFNGLEIEHVDGSGAVLCEALAYLACRVSKRVPVGDHLLLLARVVSGKVLNEGQPMVHIRKSGSHY